MNSIAICIDIFGKSGGVFSFIYKTVSVHPPLSKSPGAAGGVIGYWTHRAIATKECRNVSNLGGGSHKRTTFDQVFSFVSDKTIFERGQIDLQGLGFQHP